LRCRRTRGCNRGLSAGLCCVRAGRTQQQPSRHHECRHAFHDRCTARRPRRVPLHHEWPHEASGEADLLQPTIAEEDQKSFRGPLGLYLKLIWLNAEAATGAADVSGNADFGPTQPERDVFAFLNDRLNETKQRFDELFGTDIPAFNSAIGAKGLAAIVPVKEVLPEFPPAREKKEDE